MKSGAAKGFVAGKDVMSSQKGEKTEPETGDSSEKSILNCPRVSVCLSVCLKP